MSSRGGVRTLTKHPGPDWQLEARCAEVDPEAWFPELGSYAAPSVYAICTACPVRRPCLIAALRGHEEGVWAGTTETDRKALIHLMQIGIPVATVLNLGLALAEHKPRRGTTQTNDAPEQSKQPQTDEADVA